MITGAYTHKEISTHYVQSMEFAKKKKPRPDTIFRPSAPLEKNCPGDEASVWSCVRTPTVGLPKGDYYRDRFHCINNYANMYNECLAPTICYDY